MIAIIGLLTYLPIQFIILYSEHYVSASLATAVFRTSPLLMLIFIPTILKERLTKSQVLALGLAFVGIYAAVTNGTFQLATTASDLPIIALLAFGALAYALSSALLKKYMFDMASAVFLFLVFMFALFTALFFITGAQFSPITPLVVLATLYISLANNIYGFYTYFVSLRMLKTTLVTNIYFLSPFLTFGFAYLLLGETIQPYYITIAVLVAVGIFIQKLDKVGGTYLTNKTRRLKNTLLFDVTGAFSQTGNVAISAEINKGGRVLALKLEERHREMVDDLVRSGDHANVFTDSHSAIASEAGFVRHILGAGENDMVVMKAGSPDEGENFFEVLSDRLETSEVKKDAA